MHYAHAMDPLSPLFGRTALDLFRESTFVVAHGELERFPTWMRTEALASIEALCRSYRGRLEVAHGGQGPRGTGADAFIGEGGQTPVSGASAQALLRLGLTVYFAELGASLPASKPFVRALDAALGLPASAKLGAFANAPGSGLGLHHDSHDQLLIQLQGDKRFHVCPQRAVAHPGVPVAPTTPGFPGYESVYCDGLQVPAEAELSLVELRPGSCLFLPAGTWHRTADQAEPCLSLVVAVRAPSRIDLLSRALLSFARQSAAWRKPAYGLLDGDDADLPALLSDLATRLPLLDSTVLRDSWLTRDLRDGNTEAYPEGAGFTRYIRLPGTRVSIVEQSDGTVRCAFDSRTGLRSPVLQFSVEARAILDHVLAGSAAFEVKGVEQRFPDFEPEEVAAFLDQLARVGLLRPLTVPPFAKL